MIDQSTYYYPLLIYLSIILQVSDKINALKAAMKAFLNGVTEVCCLENKILSSNALRNFGYNMIV